MQRSINGNGKTSEGESENGRDGFLRDKLFGAAAGGLWIILALLGYLLNAEFARTHNENESMQERLAKVESDSAVLQIRVGTVPVSSQQHQELIERITKLETMLEDFIKHHDSQEKAREERERVRN